MRELRSLILLAGLCAACNSGGGGTAQELEVVGLEVLTNEPQLGHELAAAVDLLAAEHDSHVSVAFFVALRADVDAGAADPAVELVDVAGLATVLAGRNPYEVRLDVPGDTIAPGDYYLFAVVDPFDGVDEDDEGNNGPAAGEIAEHGVPITLGDAGQLLPDIALESIVVDDVSVATDVTPPAHAPVGGIADTPNSHFGVTAHVRSSGPDTLADVVLLAELEVPGLGVFPLQIWDAVADAYAGTVTIANLTANESTAIHLDLHIPTAARDALATLLPPGQVYEEDALPLGARVHVHVDPFDAHPEHEAGIVLLGDEDGQDNREAAPVSLRVFNEEDEETQAQVAGAVPTDEVKWDVPFVKSFSNGNVGVGLRFHATANVDTKGILGEAGASVPVTLVGHTADLLSLAATGRFNPLNSAETGFVVTLKALNVTLYEKRTVEDETLSPAAPLSYSKEVRFSGTFLVGPVPIVVTAGARGEVGLDIHASAGSDFQVAAEPYVKFSAFVEGGIGGSLAGCTLAVGAGVAIPLVEDRFHAGITAGVTYDSTTKIMAGSITTEVNNDVSGPSGRVYVFADASCHWAFVTVGKRFEYTLVTWKPFDRKDTLFNRTRTVSVQFP